MTTRSVEAEIGHFPFSINDKSFAMLSPISSSSWAVLVLIPAYPSDRPTGIVLLTRVQLDFKNRSFLVYLRDIRNNFKLKIRPSISWYVVC